MTLGFSMKLSIRKWPPHLGQVICCYSIRNTCYVICNVMPSELESFFGDRGGQS